MAGNHEHDHEATPAHTPTGKHAAHATALADAPAVTPLAVTLATGLAAAVLPSDRTIRLVSGTGAAVGMTVKMEQEWSTVTAIAADGVTLTLGVRGIHGSSATTHRVGAPVQVGHSVDFTIQTPVGSPIPIPYPTDPVIYYGAAGAIAIPNQDAIVFLNGAAAIAMTLAIPGTDIDGRKITIAATTAFAHTVTTSALGFKGASQIATFSGALGDGLTVIAAKGVWLTGGATGITFT